MKDHEELYVKSVQAGIRMIELMPDETVKPLIERTRETFESSRHIYRRSVKMGTGMVWMEFFLIVMLCLQIGVSAYQQHFGNALWNMLVVTFCMWVTNKVWGDIKDSKEHLGRIDALECRLNEALSAKEKQHENV